MRIVAGKFRGTHLSDFDLDTTKPTLDRVRVSIGNILQFNFDGAVAVDLFSGSGWFGLEALSRGASKVYCVDSNKQAIKIIRANFTRLKQDESQIVNSDYMDFLRTAKNKGDKFDIVFLDPPYATDFAQRAVDYIIEHDMMNAGGVIMRESDSTSTPLFATDKEISSHTYGRPRLEWIRF